MFFPPNYIVLGRNLHEIESLTHNLEPELPAKDAEDAKEAK